MGIQARKKIHAAGGKTSRGNTGGGTIDWRGVFARLTGRGPAGIGLTYPQAAELTWPQLLHALGIDPTRREDDLGERLRRAQDAIFDEIVDLRGCLPIDLLQIPAKDLIELAKGDGKSPAIAPLLASLRRYVNEQED